MGEQMRRVFLFVSLAIIDIGLYLKFFYDVPDSQETINFFTSWFLIIVGISSLLINLFWGSPKNKKSPMFLEYLCRKHSKAYLYKELLPGLLKGLCFTSS
jgi:hypothetical protein